jgi:hypothetical protein
MTPAQIQSRVNQEAAVRLPEVIERLFFLLENPHTYHVPQNVVWKWEQTGLLEGFELDPAQKVTLAIALDRKAHEFVEMLSNTMGVIDEILVANAFFDIRRKFLRDCGRD